MASRNERQLILEEGVEATVVRGGTRIEFNAAGGIDVYGDVPVTVHPPANDRGPPPKAELRIGDRMQDGTRYAGISPDTGKAMYTTPADAPLTYTFNKAREYAAELDAHGHQDWRVPTKAELNVLFQNRAAIGGFNETGSYPAGWYWSSSQGNYYSAWYQRFSDGYQDVYIKSVSSSLRCVR